MPESQANVAVMLISVAVGGGRKLGGKGARGAIEKLKQIRTTKIFTACPATHTPVYI